MSTGRHVGGDAEGGETIEQKSFLLESINAHPLDEGSSILKEKQFKRLGSEVDRI
jgi:hypothetical protein